MDKVGIIGVGQSKFVRAFNGSIRELAFEAFREAMKDAKTTTGDIDATIICSAPEYDKQRSPSGILAEYFGLNPQPTCYVESLCSSSTTGLRLAYSLVKSGLHDVVLVAGFQKMSEITSAESQERMGRGADIQWEAPFGTMMPAYYAMFAQGHMAKYGTTSEDLALIRLKSSIYGALNEKAMIRKPLSPEIFEDSANQLNNPISSPLRVRDCCANADGASCIIVASEKRARALGGKPVWIKGLGSATASVNIGGAGPFPRTRSGGRGCQAGLQDGPHRARRGLTLPRSTTVSPLPS